MYKRLLILSVIIILTLCVFVWMGYHSIQIRKQGMEGARLGEFAAVAEQIRQDVTRKLDEFMQIEQDRPYTDYQYYYVPENVAPGQQQMPVLRSPLSGRMEHGLAYGNFQIGPGGNIITPNDSIEQDIADPNNELYTMALLNRQNIEKNLLPSLSGATPGAMKINLYKEGKAVPQIESQPSEQILSAQSQTSNLLQSQRAKNYPIESLLSKDRQTRVIQQKRSILEQNVASNEAAQSLQPMKEEAVQDQHPSTVVTSVGQTTDVYKGQVLSVDESQAEAVQIRIEPFVPVIVPGEQAERSFFGGQVFLLRHVQIENNHLLQGFKLNEKKLIEEIYKSASRFMRKGMSFELSPRENAHSDANIAYAAILNFGFGDLVLNLKETEPDWIRKQIINLQYWYFSVISVVLLAVTLGLASLWRNARAQIKLAQKKDDFISAVSHELRTPLTSIRMYSEMLEKNWVKSQDKIAEYYRSLRQESERLSRLIENVLDFSRIQRGQKEYIFKTGDINKCVADVVEMMKPYATQRGFSIKTKFGQLKQTAFDSDVVTQIVVNLLDNAIKYSHNADDKTITIRTASTDEFIFIDVEDHGPGVPHRQQKKIFEEFYRSGAEATRETTGTGLGLALVSKFAEAHNGFVKIINAKPTGAIFRVALSIRK